MPSIINNEPCYIYHVRDYQEHSLFLETITLNYGPITVLARGAKRARSPLQGVLQPFVPLRISIKQSQRGDLFYLTDYAFCGEGYNFKMPEYFCGLYLNELLHYLYRSGDDNGNLDVFASYLQCLEAIDHHEHIELNLRLFELNLLKTIGYAVPVCDDGGAPLQPNEPYRYCFGVGFIQFDQEMIELCNEITGSTPQRVGGDGAEDSADVTAPAPAPDASADDDSALLFAKSKVRGRKLEDKPRMTTGAYFNEDPWVYLPQATSFGGSEKQVPKLTREQKRAKLRFYQHDLLGPLLTGIQILDIATHKLHKPQALANAKQLTSAIMSRLLHGREIESRRLYREYLQMLKQKQQAKKDAVATTAAPAPGEATPAAATTEQE